MTEEKRSSVLLNSADPEIVEQYFELIENLRDLYGQQVNDTHQHE